MSIFDKVSDDIKEAMKAKDKVKLEALRNVKKYFIEAKTAPGANDTLSDEAATKMIQKLVKQGKTLLKFISVRIVRTLQTEN